ncbi:MAG TPA: 1-(5-phosphoribosyl)-5-[(5-phosphoribosylamino)methylideneamino]imidazole-4-carboxamide isomerase [Alphaproteobacteria bacterium]|nr:1-(5-phosphoribosyl)-5-[(5-phosphoribosylamino)methylideneamino]imidazole-4-carboxamide isomerase [Alphaproteobacteria bacterium]
MILFPAIDLKDGACVRLLRGRREEATLYNSDPAAQASTFAAAGSEWLHVVDLDGAFAGRPKNAAAVRAILAAVAIPLQLGGGIRDMSAVEGWLAAGVERVILGTAALGNPALVREAAKAFPGRIAVGIDARHGKVATEGWVKTSETDAATLALAFEDAGLAAIVYTDIERDGALEGPNVEATAALARRLTTPVIASGGVASLADLEALKAHEGDGIAGVIVGKALYDGSLELGAALRLLAA